MTINPVALKQQFDEQGYVVIENLLDPTTLGQVREALDRITTNPKQAASALQHFIHYERDYLASRPHYNDRGADQMGDAIRVLMELPRFDPVFEDLVLYDPLLDVVQALFDSTEFHFHNYKCVVKAPLISSTFCWHRDLPYLNHTTPNLLTAMLCVDDMTPASGATVVMPGTHRISHDQFRESDTDIPEDQLPDGPRVTVCCPAGSAVLFHVNIIHGGGPNRSPRPRRNVISIWAGPDTYPTRMNRYACQGIYPRSQDPARQRQVRLSFPRLFPHEKPLLQGATA